MFALLKIVSYILFSFGLSIHKNRIKFRRVMNELGGAQCP